MSSFLLSESICKNILIITELTYVKENNSRYRHIYKYVYRLIYWYYKFERLLEMNVRRVFVIFIFIIPVDTHSMW